MKQKTRLTNWIKATDATWLAWLHREVARRVEKGDVVFVETHKEGVAMFKEKQA